MPDRHPVEFVQQVTDQVVPRIPGGLGQ